MELWNKITVTDIESILTVTSTRGRRLEMKNRRCYGLSFCLDEGRIVYTKDGKHYDSERGTAVLLPARASYLLTAPETGEFPLINFFAPEGLSDGEIVVTRLRNPDVYFRDYARLRDAWLVRRDRAKAMSILYEIFSALAHEEESDAYHPLRPAVELLTARFAEPDLSCTALARAAGLSEVYFRRLFKARYGIPPKQYLLELRLHRARTLLSENRLSVSEIAEACGFSSVYHFCRSFRNSTGETPSEYRRRERF